MQNLIAAALIRSCAGAISNEGSSVLRYIKDLLSCMDRIIGTKKRMKQLLWIRDNFRRNLQSGLDRVNFRAMKNLRIN